VDILVIGDFEHSRATCVHWMQRFPNIEEFDLVIIAQTSLSQEVFDQITDKPSEIRSQIQTVFKTGRSVWCIIEKLLKPSRGGWVEGYGPTSYDWLFVYPKIKEVVEGLTVQVVDKAFAPYLEKVKRWNMEIENVFVRQLVDGSMRAVEPEGIVLEPIAINKSRKMIGTRILLDPRLYGDSGSICLLPKPSECNVHEAIETLLDIATGEERVEPEWRERVEIPGINEVENQVKQLKVDYDKQMRDLQLRLQSIDKYRDVFSVHELPQINSVQLILRDIGVQTERTKPGFPVDLLGKEVAVEVTSITGKVNSDSPKMFQLTQFFEKHHKKEKVILIANTYKREHPSVRRGKQDFTPPVIDFLKLKQVCALTCVTLIDLWKLGLSDPTKARKLLLETLGELKL
jgi:hypothetical protein